MLIYRVIQVLSGNELETALNDISKDGWSLHSFTNYLYQQDQQKPSFPSPYFQPQTSVAFTAVLVKDGD